MRQSKSILAVLVLYKRRAEESQAYVSLQQILTENEAFAAPIELMLCDNTPTLQSPPAGFAGIYLSDPSNPGLAKHYNAAFRIAEERGIPWLMLFDQDTTPTREYVDELVAQIDALTADPQIVAILPKLHNGRKICSPYTTPKWSHKTVSTTEWGRSGPILFGFNSGAVLRVEAVREIEGFPEEFWLDYLDYVMFNKLQKRGGHFYVMKSILRHHLASSNARTHMSAVRYKNILHAERVYYDQYGTPQDRFFLRIRQLKITLRLLLKDRQAYLAYLTLRSALRIV